jgi:hypothetical protein
MKELYFVPPDTWNGAYYELAIEVCRQRSDVKLLAALQAIWEYPDLEGYYRHRDVEPSLQERITVSSSDLQDGGPLQGLARLPNGLRVACCTYLMREDDGSDWLDFCLPMGALSTAYDVGAFPFGTGANHASWRIPMDNWLLDIGRHVFRDVKFELALIGHEVSGETNATAILASGIPEKRWIGYLYPQNDKLTYYPPNQYQAPFTF